MKGRQTTLDAGKVTDRNGIEVEPCHQQSHGNNRCQCRRETASHFRQEVNNKQGKHNQAGKNQQRITTQPLLYTFRRGHLEVLQLCEKDNDRQAIHKTQHDRIRHNANKLAESQRTGTHLEQAGQHHRSEQVLDAMLGNQRHHHHRHGTGSTGYHAGTPTEYGCQQTDHEGGIQTYQRIDPGHKRKGHGFRHQRQCHGKT